VVLTDPVLLHRQRINGREGGLVVYQGDTGNELRLLPPYQGEDLSEMGMQNRDAVLHTPAYPLRDMLKGKQKRG